MRRLVVLAPAAGQSDGGNADSALHASRDRARQKRTQHPCQLLSDSAAKYPRGVWYADRVEPKNTPTHGYSASKEQLRNRLARVEGQVRGVARMVEEDRYCIDVLTQIAAIQAALEKIALGLVDGHVRVCMRPDGSAPADLEAQVDELMGTIGRLVKR